MIPLRPLHVVIVDLDGEIASFCNNTGVPPDSYDLLLTLKRLADIMCPDVRVFSALLDAFAAQTQSNHFVSPEAEEANVSLYALGMSLFFKLHALRAVQPHYTYIVAKVTGETLAIYIDQNVQTLYANMS